MQDFLTQKLATMPMRNLPQAGYRTAAVLLAITNEDNPHVILTQRTQNLSTHKGQVAFPGGKCDEDDADIIATALREAYEEVGLPMDAVDVVGVMPQVYSRHGFIVTPVVGLIDAKQVSHLRMNSAEIDHLFSVPVDYLLNTKPQMDAVSMLQGFYQVPRFKYQQFVIWGMTAFVLAEFLNHTYDAGFAIQQPVK